MNPTLKKNSTVITSQDGSAGTGNTLTYNEILQPGATYEVVVTTHSG